MGFHKTGRGTSLGTTNADDLAHRAEPARGPRHEYPATEADRRDVEKTITPRSAPAPRSRPKPHGAHR